MDPQIRNLSLNACQSLFKKENAKFWLSFPLVPDTFLGQGILECPTHVFKFVDKKIPKQLTRKGPFKT